ncbi:MAG: GtrA family protein [Salibacteraceae bacterium]|jgi:putative flippase GtrA|nr:GtrA family protein [Salibacteraceae bacterium]MDP4845590.1 GtrA family protein [Salibacteraceae bacterium]
MFLIRKIGKLFTDWVQSVIDFFYPPFSKFMTLQFFRYGAVGGFNLLVDWTLYFIIYQFVLEKSLVDFGFIAVSSHIATLGIKFPAMLLFGFLMQKYITFSTSEIRGRVQLLRYSLVVGLNLFISYIGIKFLVESVHLFPSISNMIVTLFTIIISYLSQKHFTFKTVTATKD